MCQIKEKKITSSLLNSTSLYIIWCKNSTSTHKPVIIHNTKHSISLYADDILLYLQDIYRSLPAILKIFHKFSNISGYRVNWSKSALLSLNNMPVDLSMFNIPAVQSLKYLGISIFPSVSQTTNVNFHSILSDLKTDLTIWNKLQLTFHSCISVVKMNVLYFYILYF